MYSLSRLASSVTALAVCVSLSAMATAAALPMEEVVVVSTATRTPQPVDSVSASVVVIDRRAIEAAGAASIKEVFEMTPGLTLQYGTFPAASSASKSSVSLRGMSATGTLWLLDGRRLAGEVKNPYDMDRLPASMIERIEVVKGPMSALYGADAVGGVINIITRQPKPGVQGSLGLRYGANTDGDAQTENINATLAGGSEALRFSLYASRADAEPYSELEQTTTRLPVPMPPPPLRAVQGSYTVPVSYREAAEVSTLGGRLEWRINDKLLLGAEANWFEESREGIYRAAFHPTGFSPFPGIRVPAFDVPVRSLDDNTRLDFGLDVAYQPSDLLNIEVRYYRSDYEKRNNTLMLEYADFAYASAAASAASGLNANVEVDAIETLVSWSLTDNHLLTFGGELRDEAREASAFSQSNALALREVEYRALFLQDEWSLSETFSLTLGGRYDVYEQAAYTDSAGMPRDSREDSETTLRLGAVKAFSDALIVRANFAQGYRVPDIRELFIQKQTPAGLQLGAQAIDPRFNKQGYDLSPEATQALELAFSGKSGAMRYEVALFHNDISDRIQQLAVDANNDARDDYFTFMNLDSATTYGLEASLSYAVSDAVAVAFSWTELQTENDDSGEELAFNPERVVALQLDWRPLDSLQLALHVQYTGEQFYLDDGVATSTDDFTLLNINASYQLGTAQDWTLYAGVKNLFDAAVDERIGSNPGTYLLAGIRKRF